MIYIGIDYLLGLGCIINFTVIIIICIGIIQCSVQIVNGPISLFNIIIILYIIIVIIVADIVIGVYTQYRTLVELSAS